MNLPAIYTLVFIFLTYFSSTAFSQSFEKTRCQCICPNTSVVEETKNKSMEDRRVYTKNVKARDCLCDNVVLPALTTKLSDDLSSKFCLRCTCKYETRDTTMIQVVVILVICVISLLVVYMGFLLCLDPMMKQPRKDHPYERHQNDEDNIFAPPHSINDNPIPSSSMEYAETRQRRPSEGVLGRVEAQQSKWFQKVHEQRRKIFTDHSMLN